MQEHHAIFEEAFVGIADAVLGSKMSAAFASDEQRADGAIGEILKHYKVKACEVPESVKGIHDQLEYLLRLHGIMRRNVNLEAGWYKDAIGALLGTRKDDGSVVAFIPKGLAGYVYFDTPTGKWIKVNKKNQDLFETEGICFYKPFPLKKLTVATLAKYIIDSLSVADHYAFNTAYGMVSGAFMSLAGITTTIAQFKPIIEMAKTILDAVPEVSEGKRVIERLSGGIELNNVSFRYNENMPLVIDDLSLKIRPGQYVAIVDSTGCGKSTLMRIMLGFEKPQKGAVYYDGKDLSTIDLKSLRRKIGVVMQNGKLFQGDIFSNITISAPQLTLDAAWEAAEMAGIAEDIRRMPMGMHTIISEGSGGISGGQRQRLDV